MLGDCTARMQCHPLAVPQVQAVHYRTQKRIRTRRGEALEMVNGHLSPLPQSLARPSNPHQKDCATEAFLPPILPG